MPRAKTTYAITEAAVDTSSPSSALAASEPARLPISTRLPVPRSGGRAGAPPPRARQPATRLPTRGDGPSNLPPRRLGSEQPPAAGLASPVIYWGVRRAATARLTEAASKRDAACGLGVVPPGESGRMPSSPRILSQRPRLTPCHVVTCYKHVTESESRFLRQLEPSA